MHVLSDINRYIARDLELSGKRMQNIQINSSDFNSTHFLQLTPKLNGAHNVPWNNNENLICVCSYDDGTHSTCAVDIDANGKLYIQLGSIQFDNNRKNITCEISFTGTDSIYIYKITTSSFTINVM